MIKNIFVLTLCLMAAAHPWVRESRAASDPLQVWATRLGGTAVAPGDDLELAGIATDASGNIYVTGRTYSDNFRGGSNNASANNSHKGGFDAFVAKLTADGELTWTTFLGGSDDDYGTGIAIDGAGSVYVTGLTYSDSLRGGSNNAPANNSQKGGVDAFVAKLTADGALAWTTFLGGSGTDYGFAISLDSSGNPHAAGSTLSDNFKGGSNNTGMNNARKGFDDAFVVKLTSSGAMTWGTHVGGSDEDLGYGVAVDSSGNVYVNGETASNDFSARNNTYRGGNKDGFLAKVSSAGALAWSTYLGGAFADWASGVAIDGSNSLYVAGYTEGGFTGGSSNAWANNIPKGGSDAFAARMTTAGALTWATYLGGMNADWGFAVAVDGSGNVCVTGGTSSSIFMGGSNNKNPANNYKGISDAFAAQLTSAGAMTWATYIGGENIDSGLAVTADASGNVFVAGDAASISLRGGDNNGSTNNSRKSADDMFVSKLGPAPPVTVTLKGPGVLNITFEPNEIDIALIELTGTTERSSLSISTKLKSTRVQLDELDVAGSLKDIKAKAVTLTGSLTATGGLGKVSLTAALPGSSIQAPWISSLSIAGDFAGDMVLTGAGAPPKGLTLGKASVKGILLGSVWHISGNAGSVKAGTWGAGSILAVGVDAGVDGKFFTGDDVATGGSLGSVKYKHYATDNSGDAFGIIADAILKIKTLLPFVDADFNIRML